MKLISCLIVFMICIGANAALASGQPGRDEAWSLAQQIRRCVIMPIKQSGEATIEFQLNSDGTVTDAKVVKSGNLINYIVGVFAIRAIKRCEPYKTSISGPIVVPFKFNENEPTRATSAPQSVGKML
ncbi:energy transducer TonB [Ochrobactrum sp. Marseille-Q0166]|uniref:energy transducer TonB family protein n=1 Tax=Ochrobactrum sp. Marseille-Q0166 TaxID=2761105 RepID=UPI001655ECEB|nr:energy transducer TonB [Ochrobactrum sp. Marseille-Q0166]MBC8719315.1 energy transducer TonB [Ochrobactrum sp. Marseille-Q0166]